MNIHNRTSLATEEIERLIQFAAGLTDVSNLYFDISWCNRMARRSVFYKPPPRPKIVIRIKKTGFPQAWGYELKGEPKLMLNNWQEALVQIAAHEIAHYQQYIAGKKSSELDAQIIGNSRVKEFRKFQNINHFLKGSSVMKKYVVQTGEVYQVKVSGKLAQVRIIGGNPHGGWDGINLVTNKQVRIKSGARLRKPVSEKAKQAVKAAAKTNTAAQGATETKEPDTTAKSKKERTSSKPGGLSAAVKVLQEVGTPLNCKQMVEQMLEKGYWKTDGKTPSATIYSAITREIKEKGADARFRKVERGKFSLAK